MNAQEMLSHLLSLQAQGKDLAQIEFVVDCDGWIRLYPGELHIEAYTSSNGLVSRGEAIVMSWQPLPGKRVFTPIESIGAD